MTLTTTPSSSSQLGGQARFGPGQFRIDTLRSRVAFSIRHALGRVRGQFTRVTGVVGYDPRKPEATSARVAIESASVSTHNDVRDARLRGSEFFDVRSFPRITFVSSAAVSARRKLEVTGDVTLHGVTRPLTVTVLRVRIQETQSGRGTAVSARARAHLNRHDFGVGPAGALGIGGALIGDEVEIELDLELLPE